MSKLASSSVPNSSGKNTATPHSESTNAWSRTASSNIRNAPNAKVTTAPPQVTGSNSANSEIDPTVNSLRDRFIHLTLNLIGQNVQVSLTDGNVVEGILGTFTPFNPSSHPAAPGLNSQLNKYVLKYVQLVVPSGTSKPLNIQKGGTLILPVDKVSHLFAKSVRFDHRNPEALSHNNHTASSFRTDTDISQSRKEGDGRDSHDFVIAGSAWTAAPAASHSQALGELEASPDTTHAYIPSDAHQGRKGLFGTALPSYNSNNNNNRQQLQNPGGTDTPKGSIGQWDQFAANEKLYGVKASFDENLYTTVLNVDSIDKTKREEAERLAREIESQSTNNIHMAEERGHSVETDFDEEDLYSGVLKKQNSMNNSDGTKKERTKITLLARTNKEQATTNQLDEHINSGIQNTIVKANSGDNLTLNTLAATKPSSLSTPNLKVMAATASTTTSHPTTTDNEMDANLIEIPSTTTSTSAATSNTSAVKNASPPVPTTVQKTYAAALVKADAKFKNTQTSNVHTNTTATPPIAQKKLSVELSSSTASGSSTTSSHGIESVRETTTKATAKLPSDRNHVGGKVNKVPEESNASKIGALSPQVAVDSVDEKDNAPSSKIMSSKLNANAKEFTFNPDAKSFTPTFSTNTTVPSMLPAPIPQQDSDPQQFMGVGPYNPYMQHPGMQMGASMMYPYPGGGMRYYHQGGNANAPYVMMPSNPYMTHAQTQSMSVLPPRAPHESPVASINTMESTYEGGEKSRESEARSTGDVLTNNEVQGVQGEVQEVEGLDEGTQNWEQQQQQQNSGALPMGGYTSAPGTTANASVYYPGGMSLHASQPYGHMIPPQMSPMVQGHGGYSIVYGMPGHIHQGPSGIGYGQMRGHPMTYSSGPYMPYGVQGMVVPGGTGSVEGGTGRGGRGAGGMNNSVAGRGAPRRPSGRGSNAGRSGSSNNQVQSALRNALGSSTRYYPHGMLDGDNPQYENGMNPIESSSNAPYPESSAVIAESVTEESQVDR